MASAKTAFSYVKDIVFNTSATGANVASAQANFPICVHIKDGATGNWSSGETTHFFDASNTGGKRVQFFDADGTTNLAYEVSYYDSGSKEAVYWVKVPSVAGNTTTDKITVAYGNDPNSSDQDAATTVWNNGYVAVYHLGDNQWAGSAPEATDSTGVNNGTNTSSADVAGQVRRGRTFTAASSHRIQANDSTSLSFTGNFTVEAWVKPTSLPASGAFMSLLSKYDGTGNPGGFDFRLYNNSGTPQFGLLTVKSDGTTGGGDYNYTTSTSVWTHLSAVYDGSYSRMFANGAQQGTVSNAKNPADNTKKLNIANFGYYTPSTAELGRYYNGALDEIRISNTNRSADWLLLSYFTAKSTNWNGDGWLSWGTEGANVNVAGEVATATAEALTPSLSIIAYPPVMTATAEVLVPEVTTGSDINIAAEVATATAAAPTPTISLGANVQAVTATATAAAPTPSISIIFSVDVVAATAMAAGIAPTVVNVPAYTPGGGASISWLNAPIWINKPKLLHTHSPDLTPPTEETNESVYGASKYGNAKYGS